MSRKFAVTLVSYLDAFLSQLGFIGNEVSCLESRLNEAGIEVHLNAGKGKRVTGRALVNFTKRVYRTFKRKLKHKHNETVKKAITLLLNTPVSAIPHESQSPVTIRRGGGVQLESLTGAARRLSMEGTNDPGDRVVAESLLEMTRPIHTGHSPSKLRRALVSQSGSTHINLGSAASPRRLAAASLVRMRKQLSAAGSPSKTRRQQMWTRSTGNSPRKRRLKESLAVSCRKLIIVRCHTWLLI